MPVRPYDGRRAAWFERTPPHNETKALMTESIRGGRIVVVDGSNIATEGRSVPSLTQLNDAVLSFRDEHPEAAITVVVDATFGHRIDKSERKQFDEAVAHNEVVAPPAGAVGRGDAFVLSIANKVGATILSNDSFQEFHGDFPWLFDDGRLIGGKPVPHIGWVFVDRVPVKGPVSRKARNATKRRASKRASEPMPVPTSPPPAATMRPARAAQPEQAPVEPAEAAANPAPLAKGAKRRGASTAPINDLLPFLDFVEHHPVGSSVTGAVESYSSHGAYVTIGDVRGYVPLRLMGDPPPRSARDVMRLGETVTLVVAAFTAARRNVDLAIPGVEAAVDGAAPLEPEEAITAALAEAVAETAADAPPTSPKPVKRAAKKAAKEPAKQAATKRPARKAATKTAPAKQTAAKKATSKKAAAAKEATKQAATKTTPAKQATKKAPAKQATKKAAKNAAKKAPARKAPARKAPARKAAGRQATTEKSP